jgi:glycerol-1-phosphate dehydrogenase [NAD(P)+]
LFSLWEYLQEKLPAQLISSQEAIAMLKKANSPALYPEIGLSKEQYIHGIRTAQLIRKRYTILDYLYTLGLLDEAIDYIIG